MALDWSNPPRLAKLLRRVRTSPNWAMPRHAEEGEEVEALPIIDSSWYHIFPADKAKEWSADSHNKRGVIVHRSAIQFLGGE